ncbi:sensor histidine kinase [Paenibacillus sp. CMAA1364]
MWKRIREPVNRSLTNKLIMMNTAIILLLLFSIGGFSYYDYSRTLRLDVERLSNLVLKQANLNLNRYFEAYDQELLLLGSSQDFQDWLKSPKDDVINLYLAYRRMEEKNFTPFTKLHPEVLNITLFNYNGNEMNYSLTGTDKDYSVKNELWFESIPTTSKTTIFRSNTTSLLTNQGNNQELPTLTLVKYLNYIGHKGFIKLDISLTPTIEILNEMGIGDKGVGFIINKDGHILVHPESDLIMKSLDSDVIAGIKDKENGSFFRATTKDLIMFQTIPFTGWKSVVSIPYDDVLISIGRIRNATIIIGTMGLLISFLLIITVTSGSTRGLRRLRAAIKQTKLGMFEHKVLITGNDEVADVGRAYNAMLDHLNATIDQLTETKFRQQDAVHKALQSQINSHFLYNTLESINGMASLIDHKQIQTMTVGLSHMLRYTADYRHTIVSIKEEVLFLGHYLRIMQIRYSDKFQYDVTSSVEDASIPCLKAILQPITENAFKHVLEKTGKLLQLSVVVECSGGWVRIVVRDNGPGFDPSNLENIQQQLDNPDYRLQYDQLSRIGLLNVHYRLKLVYDHPHAGIQISNSSEWGGCCVILNFPDKLPERAIKA